MLIKIAHLTEFPNFCNYCSEQIKLCCADKQRKS